MPATPIFISYTRSNWDEFVSPLVEKLQSVGFLIWVDRHLIEGGQDWLDQINEALNNCQILILCVSPEALSSKYVKMEYRFFLGENKLIIPLMCQSTPLPAELRGLQYIPFSDSDRLIDRLNRYVSPNKSKQPNSALIDGRTKRLERNDLNFPKHAKFGTADLDEDESILIYINNSEKPIILEPDTKQIIFGRYDELEGEKPDIDLALYDAYELGVSRIHAKLTRNDTFLMLTDLGSTNGTYLMGQPLIEQEPRLLRNGDVIHFGKLELHLYFSNA